MNAKILESSRALWNRDHFDLNSDETLAQLMDRGEFQVWQELYQLAKSDPSLRHRILQIVSTVPLPLPHFWLAAMSSLGEIVDWNHPVPSYADSGT